MMVSTESQDIESFDPLQSMNLWMSSGERSRRPYDKDE